MTISKHETHVSVRPLDIEHEADITVEGKVALPLEVEHIVHTQNLSMADDCIVVLSIDVGA